MSKIEAEIDEKLYSLVCTSLYLSYTNKTVVELLLNDDYKCNGTTLTQVIRLVASSYYGQLTPNVFKSWGVTNDMDILTVLRKVFDDYDVEVNTTTREYLDEQHYGGKYILETVDFYECELYDWLV